MKTDNILKLLKDKDLVIPRVLFNNYKSFNIDEKELVFLTYLISYDKLISFDIEAFNSDLNWETSEIMTVVSNLCEKNIITLEVRKENNKSFEYIDITNLYEKLLMTILDEQDEFDGKSSTEIYNIIEAEFGRTLSPIEYETISSWLDSNISEELIKEALREAVLNGVNNLKYVHKILSDWTKKGYKSPKDIKRKKSSKDDNKELFEYDWLAENEQ